jgi:hypothetical protein
MKIELETEIKSLAKKADRTGADANDALKFTQAALNLAHVVATFDAIETEVEG